MKPPVKAILASVVLAGLSAGPSAGAADRRDPDPGLTSARYTVTDLGTLGGPSSRAFGINNNGQIVGEADLAPDSQGTVYRHAFLYENGGMTDLGVVGTGCDPGKSVAFDINDAGQIVGETCAYGMYPRAFVWSNGAMVDLGAQGGTTSSALAINDAGEVVGTAGGGAFLYREGSMEKLSIPHGNYFTTASDINDHGRIVGSACLTPHTCFGFVYAVTGRTVEFIVIRGPRGINDAAKVVGDSALYSQGSVTPLGSLGSGFTFALDINNYDQIVGDSHVGAFLPHAFLYRNGIMVDLNSHIPDHPEWELYSAEAINDTGLITGLGTVAGQTRGFLLTPVPMSPTAVEDSYATGFQQSLTVPAPGVLANDYCSGNCAMRAEVDTGVVHGTLTLNREGGFIYTPAAGYVGPDTFAYRAVTDGGQSNRATVRLNVIPPTSVQPPTGLYTHSITDNVVTLRWVPPATGPGPTGYVVEGGVEPDGVLAAFPTGSAYPIHTFAVPSGSFHVRVHSLAGLDWSASSNDVRLHVNVPVPPSPPTGLTSVVNGSAVNLTWRNTFEGGAPSAVDLEVQAGGTTSVVPLGLTETFGATSVPAGTYTVRLRAINASGVSGPSDPVVVTVPAPCSGSPEPPVGFLAYAIGRTIFVVWDPPTAGPAATAFELIAGGTVAWRFPTRSRALSGTVGPGTYELSVVAGNACGSSPATPPQTVTIR